MAKKGEARQRITLKCTVCDEENYRTETVQKKIKEIQLNVLKQINFVQDVEK